MMVVPKVMSIMELQANARQCCSVWYVMT